jgi:TP901-1 family phage major tail protein
MAVFNATLLGVYVEDTLVAAAQDVSVSMSVETIDVTTKESGGYRELIRGLRSATYSVNGLIDYTEAVNESTADLATLLLAGTEVTLKFSTEQTGDQSVFSEAILTSLELSGGTEDTATYSATFESTGTVSLATIS